MTKELDSLSSLLALGKVYGLDSPSLDYAEKVCRAWYASAGKLQDHAAKFLNNRLAGDSAALATFGQCRTPLELFNAQVEYAQRAFADIVDESQKVAEFLGEMTTPEALFGGCLQPAPRTKRDGKRTRSTHPATAR